MAQRKQDKAVIAARLRCVRERAHITIEDAAEAIKVQPLAVEKWERGSSLPSLLEFRALMELYGIMPALVLYGAHPLDLSAEQCAELLRHAKQFSPGLQAKVHLLLAIVGPGKEPAWSAAN